MQESLNLIQIPEVDTSRLSSVGEFRRFVTQVERKYRLNLEFNNNARWRPGSYERLKGQVVKSLFPQWEEKKGANTIKKLTKYSHYNTKDLRGDLIRIDDKLRIFRQSKESLDPELAKAEGQKYLSEYMNQLIEPTNGVAITITPLPYFSQHRRSADVGYRVDADMIFERSWDIPLHPTVDSSGNIIKYNISRSAMQSLFQTYSINTNPKRWFINVIIPLEDINVEYTMDSKSTDVLYTNKYGKLVVCFTLPIYDAILNYRQLKLWKPEETCQTNMAHKLITRHYSNHTYKFPCISSIEHPFVQSGTNKYGFDIGNTCFGDFKDDVIMALSSGLMGHLKAVLTQWASTYYLRRTHPLNQTEWHHIGMPKEWEGTDISKHMGTNVEVCKRAVSDGMLIETLIESHCNNCTLKEPSEKRDICDFYKKLTTEPIEIPKEYLLALDIELDAHGVNAMADKLLIQMKCEHMWDYITAYTGVDTNNHSLAIARIFGINNRGTGNLEWHMFEDAAINLARHIGLYTNSNPTISRTFTIMAQEAYSIYKFSERVYWLDSIRSYNADLFFELEQMSYGSIEEAERERPIADYKAMVNTQRIVNNQRPYQEYLDMLSEINEGGYNSGDYDDEEPTF